MGRSKLTCELFKLKGIKSLDDVKKYILKRSHSEPLKISSRDNKIPESLPQEELNFYFTWGEVSEPNEMKLFEKNEEGSVEYLFVPADIEYTKRKKKDSAGNLLPKVDRVNYAQIMTYFFCINNSVHLIISSPNEIHVNRVKKLVGLQYISKLDENYVMPPDLFNWLFYKYIQNNGELDSKLMLMNIGGFIGNTGDEHNIFKGTSDQTSELIITKAFISNGETLRTITARLKNEDIDIVFTIDDLSNTQIFFNQSEKIKLFEAEDDGVFFIIYLYSQLIPKLKSLYNNSSAQFLKKEKSEFSEEIGLEVIESIIIQNSLSLKEVTKLFDRPIELHEKIYNE
ncbi:hypothetical protein [Salimicrobium halophilum]|uniref:Uncharacterized protein n=1 Tax=Salimicrobium halophilum TaxID=86666 RepID=A0A1G8WHI9_9BACI|nr:hypothetical protein [Salimicrobium halophilum]SDJ77778.1 hypothetical protein SAMN04490247_3190 [Salimicrobium halophilum]